MPGQLECIRPKIGSTGAALRMEDFSMLVLTRKIGEELVIDHPSTGKITLRITRIGGNRVSIGVDARREVSVKRGELREKPKGERAA